MKKTLREKIRDKKYPNGFMKPVFPKGCNKRTKRTEKNVSPWRGKTIHLIENEY